MTEFTDAVKYDIEGNATLSVDAITEEINDAYLDKHVNGKVCSLTWHLFTQAQWVLILDLIDKRPEITKLLLEHGTMSESVASRIVAIEHITFLSVETMDIEAPAITKLASSKTITELELIRFDKLTKEALEPFAHNTSIKTLYIADMSVVEASGIVALLAGNKTLKHLKLRNLEIPEDDLAAIFSNDLQHGLTRVTLEQELTEKGMRAIVANTKIDVLDLGFYPLPPAVGEILASAEHISVLTLLNMEVSNELVELLSKNTHIKSLNLSQNQTVTDEGAAFLAQNKTLTILNLAGCKVSNTGWEYFLENTTLLDLTLSKNELKGKFKASHTKVQAHISKNLSRK